MGEPEMSGAFRLTWRDGAYRVSVPNFLPNDGDSLEVMPVAEHEAEVRRLKMQMQDMREGLCDVLRERHA